VAYPYDGPMNPAKAATLTGSAYRDHLDHQIMSAIRKHYWAPGSRMVACDTLNADGAKRFFVRVAYFAGSIGGAHRDITVHHDMSAGDFRRATPESFEILGKLLATMANEQLEALFMGMD
jgi:hypothetical protein